MARTTSIKSWTVARVLEQLPKLGWLNQREPLQALSGQQAELRDSLRGELHKIEGQAQLNAAVLLLKLGDASGSEIFLRSLCSHDDKIQQSATRLLGELDPADSRRPNNYNIRQSVPISAADIFAPLSGHPAQPYSEPGRTALLFGLAQQQPGAELVARSILESGPAEDKLEIAAELLGTGRDGGALKVIEDLYVAASIRSIDEQRDWYRLKSTWLSIRDCCQLAAEPLRSEAAAMTMRIVKAVLDAPDQRCRTHVNDGFLDIGCATQAICYVMPDGAEQLVHRIIGGNFDDFDRDDDYARGQAIIALSNATGDRSRPMLHTRLRDIAVRQYVATALGTLSKDTNRSDDISELADALSEEKRESVIGAIVEALAAIGAKGRPHIASALDRSPPWTRMRMVWKLEGLGSRQIADMLTEAGAMDAVNDDELAEATANGIDLMGLIWAGGRRLAQRDIKCDETPPPHHAMFNDLLAVARPRIEVQNLRQSDSENYLEQPVPASPKIIQQTDLGTVCTVQFEYDGEHYSFTAKPSGRWLDVASVIGGFNDFMSKIGRHDRCFQLLTGGFYCQFVVAPREPFLAVVGRLQIPLEGDAERAGREGMAYIRRVVEGL